MPLALRALTDYFSPAAAAARQPPADISPRIIDFLDCFQRAATFSLLRIDAALCSTEAPPTTTIRPP